MSVKKVFTILVSAAAVFMFNCESPTENEDSAKKGSVSFQYQIDGGEWKEFKIEGKSGGADEYSNEGEGVDASYYSSYLGTGMVFSVNAIKYNSSSDVDQFAIYANTTIEEDTEYDITSSLGYEPDIHFSIGASDEENVNGDYDYQFTSGTLKVITYDESKGQISGTFSGTVSNENNPDETINITSGMFLVYVED